MAKPKRTIYRVIWDKPTSCWYVKDPASAISLLHDTKAFAVKEAIIKAKANCPSQILIYSKSRDTGKYRISREVSFGADNPRRQG